ncbi:ABC transporter permease [Actinomadura sp. HBU206391]|uniref:ABC transporter permease n=1 Tax=Actinomadura sp. HBU206391 TaxID=2731692 RepID=UPI00164EE8C0|nr:ABC transporter permease [Actinomadura sp. HBU206391]MBC6461054.1 ABC transporter permease [Actinomadura sp. HBU206391]
MNAKRPAKGGAQVDSDRLTGVIGADAPLPNVAGASPAPAKDVADVILTSRRTFQGTRRRVMSLIALVALWFVASLFFADSVLPGPRAVFAALWGNLQESDTYFHLYKTILRVVAGMAMAVIVGLIVGLMMGLSKFGEEFLDSWVMVAFTVPSVVYGILAILWFGLNDFAAIIAIGVTAIPAVAINIWQGVKAIDISLVHMGKAFHLSRASILRKIVIPQLVPYILAALRYALGTAWKIATVVELIGLSSGVGYQLNYWFGLFNMTQVLAWTIAFTIVLLAIEFVILKPVEKWLTRWRPSVQS